MIDASRYRSARRFLLLYPEFPTTYWGFQHALPAIGRKSIMPPLGLLTVAALSPAEIEFRLVDLNCAPLREEDLAWAEVVLLSSMLIQKRSLAVAAARCRAAGKLVVLGGPYATSSVDECRELADVVVAGEAETTWPRFLSDLAAGEVAPLYQSDEKPDVRRTPTPRFDLIRPQDYFTIPVQLSRGCPFQCEFCDIIVMFGRRPRTKTPTQVQRELDAVYATGYRGDVFFVDDNFIGDKRWTGQVLEAIQAWNERRGHPFEYMTEASVDLAQYPRLLHGMVAANFRRVFLGIESPSAASLEETKKYQNLRRSLVESVETIAAAGLNVMGGFIMGFDSDPPNIDALQLELIGKLPIPLAMVARLSAPPGTPLYERMQADGRLVSEEDGFRPGSVSQTNIVPLGSPADALRAYRRVLAEAYTPRAYFARVLRANRLAPRPTGRRRRLQAALRQLRHGLSYATGPRALLGMLRQLDPAFRREARRALATLLRERPDRAGLFLTYVLVGHHMHRFTGQVLAEIDAELAQLQAAQPRGSSPRPLPLASHPV